MFCDEGKIRCAFYTINAIESLNGVIRKATFRHRMFPDDVAAMKVVWPIMDASGKWALPIRNRKSVLNRFCIEFGERGSACL